LSVTLLVFSFFSPRTIKDIAAKSSVKRKDVARSYRLLVLELGIRIPVVSPMKCVARVANKLSISERQNIRP
jgi:transcription initiation factor TFIIB